MSTKSDILLMALALAVVTVCVWVPQARADGPWPIIVRTVINGWETVTVYCSEWGQWGYLFSQGYELLGEGVRTAFPSEKALYPGVQYVAQFSRPVRDLTAGAAGAAGSSTYLWETYRGIYPALPIVPQAVVQPYLQPTHPDCTACYRLWQRLRALPWWSWERWNLQRQYDQQRCGLCG